MKLVKDPPPSPPGEVGWRPPPPGEVEDPPPQYAGFEWAVSNRDSNCLLVVCIIIYVVKGHQDENMRVDLKAKLNASDSSSLRTRLAFITIEHNKFDMRPRRKVCWDTFMRCKLINCVSEINLHDGWISLCEIWLVVGHFIWSIFRHLLHAMIDLHKLWPHKEYWTFFPVQLVM